MTLNVTVLSPLPEQKRELARLNDLAASAGEALALYRAGDHDPDLAAKFQARIDEAAAQAQEVVAMIAITEGLGSETAVTAHAA